MKRFLIILFMMTANARAGNPDTIRACSDVGYTKNRDLNNCYKSGVAGEVITACRKIGPRDIKDIDECITSGASHEKIMNCATNSKDLTNFNSCIKTTTI